MARSTHTVTNQPPPLVGYDVFTADRALTAAVERHLDPALLDEVRGELSALGRAAGSAQVQEWGVQANENPPGLRTHDRYGHRSTRSSSIRPGTGCSARASRPGLTAAWARPGGHVRRAAAFLVWTQVDAGQLLPAVDDPRGGARAAHRPRRWPPSGSPG